MSSFDFNMSFWQIQLHPESRKYTAFFMKENAISSNLFTDASDHSLGAILMQEDEEDRMRIISCASRTLKGPELNYYTTEKELLAIVYVLEKFRIYLLGAKVIIKTDHRALIFLKKCKFLNSRLIRWCLLIQDYNVDIEFIKG